MSSSARSRPKRCNAAGPGSNPRLNERSGGARSTPRPGSSLSRGCASPPAWRIPGPPGRVRGCRRGGGGEGRGLLLAGRHRRGRRGDSRIQHVLDPDHEARHGHPATGVRRRNPLLQPGAGPPTCRARVLTAHRSLCVGPGGGDRDRRPRQEGDPLPGPCRLRRERAPRALSSLRRADARVRLRKRGRTSISGWWSGVPTPSARSTCPI